MNSVISVGLDGSPTSVAAAHWAAREAHLRNLPLHMMHAWIMLKADSIEDDQNYWSRRLLDDTRKMIGELYPDLPVSVELAAKDPSDALLEVSGRSTLLALGSKGMGATGNFFLGDASYHVIGHAKRPVALFRGAHVGENAPKTLEGPVVVAMNPDRPCGEVLAFAFDSASLHGVPLVVLSVEGRHVHLHHKTDHADPAAQGALDDAVTPWCEKFPDVEVTTRVETGSPGHIVVSAEEGAELLVIGRHSRRETSTSRLGPVGHSAVHHAVCPVAIVPYA